MTAHEASELTNLQKIALIKPTIIETRVEIAREWSDEPLIRCDWRGFMSKARQRILETSGGVDAAVSEWKKENPGRIDARGNVRADMPIRPEDLEIERSDIIPDHTMFTFGRDLIRPECYSKFRAMAIFKHLIMSSS